MADITKIVYRCDPESLGDMSEAAFVEAFECEVYAMPLFRACSVNVEFCPGSSKLCSVCGADLPEDPVDAYSESIEAAAERAFAAICSNE